MGIKNDMLVQRVVAIGALTLLLLPATSVFAGSAFYKCVGNDGSTTYNDTPCAADEDVQRLSKSARALETLDCRIAYNFAFDAVARMRQDDSATQVFDAYGGAESLSQDARNLINQVYSFESDNTISSQTIVDITIDRCEAGLLGSELDKCTAFPKDFIDRFGSCMGAKHSEQSTLLQPAQSPTANTGNKTAANAPELGSAHLAPPESDSSLPTPANHPLHAAPEHAYPPEPDSSLE